MAQEELDNLMERKVVITQKFTVISDDSRQTLKLTVSDPLCFKCMSLLAKEDKEIILTDYRLDPEEKSVLFIFECANIEKIEGGEEYMRK